MPDLLYLLAVLACPLGMGVMMLMMMRGNHNHTPTDANTGDEVARLRSELDQLRRQQAAGQPSTNTASGS